MTESHINKLTKIDVRLQLINEERLALLNKRQELITQHEAELDKNFNLHASPESKIDLFLSYFKGRNDVYPFRCLTLLKVIHTPKYPAIVKFILFL
jgi:hypothetical protein